MLEECRTLLDNVVLQPNVSDRWQWDPDIHVGYTVRGAYHALTSTDTHIPDATENLVWHKQVPLKVSIVAWRLLKDRLPTKENLVSHKQVPLKVSIVAWRLLAPLCLAGVE